MVTFVLFLFFLLRLSTAAAAAAEAYTPTDYFLLNCGSDKNSSDQNLRSWDGDANSKFISSNAGNTSFKATADEQDPSVALVPYTTARIFSSSFTYAFPVSAGLKFVRFYFYPAAYSSVDKNKTQFFFSVTANDHTLLSNFSAYLAVSSIEPPVASLVKEFIVNIKDEQILNVTFNPSPDSYGFVNGIEVVSIPDNLYIRGGGQSPKLVKQMNSVFHVANNSAFETLYRLNIGGTEVSSTEDSGLFREWSMDETYIYSAAHGFTPQRNVRIEYTAETPAYSAPELVYTSSRTMGNFSTRFRLTWIFTVDSGFYYLLRLHFCEIQLEITKPNQRVFSVFMNNMTAETAADVVEWTKDEERDAGTPIFKDYVVMVPDVSGGSRGKRDLWLAMAPYQNEVAPAQYEDALLNGLEIFKLNRSDGSLAAPNPEPPPVEVSAPSQRGKKKSGPSKLLGAVVGGVIGGLVVVSALGFLIFRRRRRVKDFVDTSLDKPSWVPLSSGSRSSKTSASGSSLPSDLCRHFLLDEIKSATGDFDANFVIGTGGFGNVYRGYIDNGATVVAIKRLNPSSKQGAREFQTEIEMLSKLRHVHLVSLIGYCDENGEMILVYDYMARGTLRDHLYKTENPPIPWQKRLQICIGAAKGLHYLHTGAKHSIIHRDVKSTNILLDEKWVAKVSDFGLSKIGPTGGTNTHVSTMVKGSFGYVDPEYYRRQQLTDKSDVYSFGVVLFEVLCGRPAIIPNLPKEQVNLAEWARYSYRKGTVDQLVDPNLKGAIAPECLSKFVETANNCLRTQGIDRPAMSDIVWSLEFALQLQQAAEKTGGRVAEDNGAWNPVSPSFPLLSIDHTTGTEDDDEDMVMFSDTSKSKSSGTSVSRDEVASQTVFSEIKNPVGR